MGESKGKAARITGASRGLGWHLAEGLGNKDCDIILCARMQDALDIELATVDT